MRGTAVSAKLRPVVEVLSAEKVFPNGTRALAPIDLTIADGEFLTLIGPSGCGKSTLLKLIANLLEPSDGRILWWRGPFDKVGSDGRSLSFVFQDRTRCRGRAWRRMCGCRSTWRATRHVASRKLDTFASSLVAQADVLGLCSGGQAT